MNKLCLRGIIGLVGLGLVYAVVRHDPPGLNDLQKFQDSTRNSVREQGISKSSEKVQYSKKT